MPTEESGGALNRWESKDRCSCSELNTVAQRAAITVKRIEENLFKFSSFPEKDFSKLSVRPSALSQCRLRNLLFRALSGLAGYGNFPSSVTASHRKSAPSSKDRTRMRSSRP